MTGGSSVIMPSFKATGIAVWILIATYTAAAFLPLFRYWRSAVILYAIAAAGAIVRAVPASALVVADHSGASWKVADINQACALVSVLTMGSFVLLASVRLGQSSRTRGFREFAGRVPPTQAGFALKSRPFFRSPDHRGVPGKPGFGLLGWQRITRSPDSSSKGVS